MKSATTYKTSWGSLANTTECSKDFLRRNEMPSASAFELQADYLAGVWALSIQDRNLLDIGDIEEAMNAAHAVGDDTLQEQAYGYSVPDSFTHGTSGNVCAGSNGATSNGDLQHGDTFSLSDSEL